ncbi:5-hydroxytryptamine receptor 3C-like [Gadus chalcogrammus]|uniref:5-hydroxytryptamine receptor 3C-like n=1 Tax=Gadus chalcogrammus TaxID=1042646 RepID=UPI0024C4D5A5|nr:5-hydroxytryptamine receptor 3C-like [Gadus chalcogrammus]
MACVPILLLVFLTGCLGSQKVCSYHDILVHLNLTRDNEMYTATRPVLDHTHPTVVRMDLALYAILAVIEKTQTFTPFIWIILMWNNERVSWDPAMFCGITELSIPKEMLWKPDLLITEMTDMDNASQSPYVYITYDGNVTFEEDLKVVSTCKMDVHKFPFDTQSCNITVMSILHSVSQLRLTPSSNSSRITQFTRRVMQTQGEWEFLSLAVTNELFVLGDQNWDQIIYTISMKRRPLLHVINFLLPVLFFLCLDLSSFLISDHRGDKLGFKVTVLLAISVLLLILNEILPSMSNRTPLIATYCIVIFAMMLLSLLETVLVTHLMEKDSQQKGVPEREAVLVEDLEGKQVKAASPSSPASPASPSSPSPLEKGCARCACVCDWLRSETPRDHLPMAEQVADGGPAGGDAHLWLMVLQELRELKGLALAWVRQAHGGHPGYWTRLAYRINVGFFIFYVAVALFFLTLMIKEWQS